MIPVESEFPPGAVCVSTGELTRYAAFNQALSVLQVPSGTVLVWNCGPLIAHNLNNAFAHALERPELQWAWIMGDDHTFVPEIVLRLLARQQDVVVPLCLNRTPPCGFTIIDERNNRHRDFDKVPTSGAFRLEDFEVCGDAGMLLSRRALEKFGPPWYETLISGSFTSEDRYFARKIRNAGFDIRVDAEVVLDHVTPCKITPVATEDGWLVRFSVGHQPLVQFRPVPSDEVPA